MCKFVSGIVLKTGEIICEPEFSDSHETLIRMAGITENLLATGTEFLARFEFTPPADITKISDTSLWALRADEDVKPSWWKEEKVRGYCERKVKSMIISGPKATIFGGCWILDGKEASLKQLVRGRIVAVVNGSNLSGANLYGADLSRADLYGSNLSRADLYGANLYGSNLSGSNLSGSNLSGSNLSGANLSGSNLSRANLSGSNLYGANLSGSNLSGSNLSRANLYGSNLSGSNLSGADLSRADLYGANLSRADLYGANLSRADLSGSNNYILPEIWSIDQNGLVTRK